jgi:long-chain acyl-CoA synthetase
MKMIEDNLTVLDLLERSCAKAPKNIAIVSAAGAMTYEELVARSKRLGASIAAACSGNVVALFFPMVPEFVVAYFGALYANKCVVPLNLLLPPDQLNYIVKDSGAVGIIAPPAAALPPELAAKVQQAGVPVHDLAALAGNTAAPPVQRKQTPDDVCTFLYTSGTTGSPKGVMLTERNLASNASSSVIAMRLDAASRFLACLPTFHTFAITGTMLAPLAAGASLATLPKFDPELVLSSAANLKCDTLLMVPSMYRLVTRMQERRPQDLKHLRLAIAGGEALPGEVRERFEKVFGLPLLEGYGQTESSPIIAVNMPWANKTGTVGRPIPDVRVRIVDPNTSQELPADTTGEIWVSGPNVMKGYHNRPEETEKAITKDGWLRTGDMGELTPDGYIRITGRLREMIKVAGEMVFLAEVEHALLTHPSVFEAGVAGAKDERKGEIVKAYVVLKPNEKATEDELLQHCRANLAAYKVPKTVEFRTELPKGPTGKVMRRLLK